MNQIIIGIETDPRREVDVRLYDTVAAMRAAASRHNNYPRSRRRRQRNEHAHTLGVCHRFELVEFPDWTSRPLCAIVRMARGHVPVYIVAHEMAHAALWVWELEHPDERLVCDDDEQFAWVLGELVRRTVDWLDRLGVYDEPQAVDAPP